MTTQATKATDRDSVEQGIRDSYRTWERVFYHERAEHSSQICYLVNRYTNAYFAELCRYMGLSVSKDDTRLLSYYETPEKRKEGRRNKIKPGKFLRKYLPYLSDSEVESFTQAYKSMFEPRVYTIVDSAEESDFIKAYTHTITQGTNPEYLSFESYEDVKSLSGSCMRDKFSFKHPAAAYASGDFRIMYAVEVGTGNIGARVVVGNDSAAPIYTNCDQATKALSEYLSAQNIDADSNWSGLKLQKIPLNDYGSDKYLCPYLDGYSYVKDDGDNLLVDMGSITFHTQGYVTCEEMSYCEECEEERPESDMEEVNNGIFVCRCCRGNCYTYSTLMCEYIRDSECIPVDGCVATQDWIDENDYVYCSASDEYRELSDCIEYDGEYFAKDSYVVQEIDGTYYHADSQEYSDAVEEEENRKKVETEAYEVKETKALSWLKSSYMCGESPSPYLEYTVTREISLRLNYELDSNGLPYRLPEFTFA